MTERPQPSLEANYAQLTAILTSIRQTRTLNELHSGSWKPVADTSLSPDGLPHVVGLNPNKAPTFSYWHTLVDNSEHPLFSESFFEEIMLLDYQTELEIRATLGLTEEEEFSPEIKKKLITVHEVLSTYLSVFYKVLMTLELTCSQKMQLIETENVMEPLLEEFPLLRQSVETLCNSLYRELGAFDVHADLKPLFDLALDHFDLDYLSSAARTELWRLVRSDLEVFYDQCLDQALKEQQDFWDIVAAKINALESSFIAADEALEVEEDHINAHLNRALNKVLKRGHYQITDNEKLHVYSQVIEQCRSNFYAFQTALASRRDKKSPAYKKMRATRSQELRAEIEALVAQAVQDLKTS